MKKLIIPALLAGAFFSSCAKTRTCECVLTDKTDGSTTTISYTITATKRQMNSVCQGYAVDTPEESYKCEIK